MTARLAAENESSDDTGDGEADDFGEHVTDGVTGGETVPVPVGNVGW